MKVQIRHLGGKQFEADNGKKTFVINPEEVSPIEYFALGMISCSGVDIAMMSAKQGFSLNNFLMEAEIERNGDYPQKFNAAHLLYRFETDAPDDTAKKWVMASIETYCSTINTLRNAVALSYSVVSNKTTIIDRKAIAATDAAIDMGEIGGCCTA